MPMTQALSLSLPLWPAGAPLALGTEPADIPQVTVCLPPAERATGAAVVVCPGGAYGHLADHEKYPVAEWLNARGVAAVLLTYRLGPRYHHPAPLLDAQRALRLTRARAAEWGINPQRIGIWGFSAGGHLAATAGTHFDAGEATAADPIDRVSCRPDFLILTYPVITLAPPFTHVGSCWNLLGEDPDPALVASLCNETQVTPDTPPTFLLHTTADTAVPAENSINFYLGLRAAGVPAEMHIFEHGQHGFGLALDRPGPAWAERLADWMRGRSLAE